MPTMFSDRPPEVTTSRSLSPASVSIELRNEPAAAPPARSIASTTATPKAIAKIVSEERTGSRKSARNSNALHLPARKLVGIAMTEAFEFHPSKPFSCRFARTGLPCKEQRQLDVFKYRQRVQQLKRLKNEANSLAAQLRQAAVFQRRRRNSVQKHVAGSGKIHRACQIKQRGFSATAASHHRHKFASLNVQGNTAERMHALAVRQIVF